MTTIRDLPHTAAMTTAVLLGHHCLTALLTAAVFTLLIFGFVVLPAVWSRHPYRRRAATTVLQIILTSLHRPNPQHRTTPTRRRCQCNGHSARSRRMSSRL
jgi:hypothetical protein